MELEGWKSEAMIFDRLIHNPHACHRNGRAYRRALAQVVRDKAGNAFSTVGNNEAAEGEEGGGERREKGERERKKKEGEVEAWIFHAAVDSRRFDSHAGRAFFARYRNSKERTAEVRESDPNGLIVAAAAGSSPRGSIAAVCK